MVWLASHGPRAMQFLGSCGCEHSWRSGAGGLEQTGGL